jgi:hypothetical protein
MLTRSSSLADMAVFPFAAKNLPELLCIPERHFGAPPYYLDYSIDPALVFWVTLEDSNNVVFHQCALTRATEISQARIRKSLLKMAYI